MSTEAHVGRSETRSRVVDAAGPADSPGRPTAGRWIASAVLDAVNETERLICCEGAVRAASVAEGLAASGRRAATLLDADPALAPPVVEPALEAGWVHHRLRPGTADPVARMAFELVATGPQDALDHCLVAHRLVRRLGRPGVCTVDDEIARRLHLLRISNEKVIVELVDAAPLSPAGENDAPEELLEHAFEAFDAVSARTRRPCQALAAHRVEGTSFVLVTSGHPTGAAIDAADRLQASGVRCGVLSVALMRPFPADELSRRLRDAKVVVVVEPRPFSGKDGDLTTEVRRAFAGTGAATLRTLIAPAGGGGEMLSAVREALDLRGSEGLSLDPPGDGQPPSERVMIGVAPAGVWSDRFLLDTAALLGRLDAVMLERPPFVRSDLSVLCVGKEPSTEPAPAEIDLLLLGDPSPIVTSLGLLGAVRRGGTVLLHAREDSQAAAWRSLGESQRRRIVERELKLLWVDIGKSPAGESGRPAAIRSLLHGAMLGAENRLGGIVDPAGDVVEKIAASVETEDAEAALLRSGAAALVHLDPETVDARAEEDAQDFRPRSDTPRMPGPEDAGADAGLREALRHFHLTGEGAHTAAEPLPSIPLRPSGLAPLVEPGRVWSDYPIVLSDEAETAPGGLHDLLERTLDAVEHESGPLPIVREHLTRLVATAGRLLEEFHEITPQPDLLRKACEAFVSRLELSDAGSTSLNEEIGRLEAHLPRSGRLLGLGRHTLLALYGEALRREREPRRRSFRETVETLVVRLDELLRVDAEHGPEGLDPATLSSTLGETAGQLFEPQALSGQLARTLDRGSKRLEPGRRERIEQTLETLRGYLESESSIPEFVLVHPGETPEGVDPEKVRLVRHPDGLRAAIGLFDGLVRPMVEVLRAVRVGRLDVEAGYDEQLHGPTLDRFGWQSLGAEELLLIPPVVVWETAERLQGQFLAPFSALLRSGRPIHVLVAEGRIREELAGFHPGLGYVAVAHREPFVLQSTLARPSHLLAGLNRMAISLRPSAALVTVPNGSGPVPAWVLLAAAFEGRATPCFLYDADRGTTWAERFDLTDNPQAEKLWPEARQAYRDAQGVEQSREEAFTFAHAAALDPAFRPHFRILPPSAWDDDQAEIADWLAADEVDRRKSLPFIWVVDDAGTLARAAMTREMAFACRDRMRAWRILQELAGTNNEYARRAAEEARRQALEEAEQARAELEAEHAEELDSVRETGAKEAMDRLVNVLMDLDTVPLPGPRPAAPVAEPVAEPAEQPQPEAEPEPAEEEAVSFDEPYIDSFLCTTCQECLNLNPQMFKYNENKQAYIADASAGTFEQLVTAAEKCPAKCIHPGVPRQGDSTATEELIARATPFN